MSAGNLFSKAERALLAARRALEHEDTETAAERGYYAAYYAAWALLDSEQMPRPRTHNGLIAEFSRVFVKSHRMEPRRAAVLSRLQNLRLVADYTLTPIPTTDAERALHEAEMFVAEARRLLRPASP